MSRLKSEKQNNAPAPQGRLLVGPGTTVLLLVLVYLCGSQFFMKPRVTIERHVDTTGAALAIRKPSISQLLSWSADLHLTARQKSALARLAKDETVSLSPIEASITDTMKEFNEFAEKHRSEAVGLKSMQTKASPLSLLSRKKRQLEQGFAEQAQAILETSQQEVAKRLWQTKLSSKHCGGKEAASP